ncbi:AAA family ATPase [Peptococcaceae bacterium]|nr:AAA family ATPase [Peptococcaceae bacterium]
MSAKIKTLTIRNFKGFSSEIKINFTNRAKNLVIYGENSSGKTSIMEALKLLFDSSHQKIEVEKYKNIFTRKSPEVVIETTDGKTINLRLKTEKKRDERGNEIDALVTDSEAYSPEVKPYLEAISKSTSILSYRELMKIYNIKTDEDLYNLFVRKIMGYYLIPPKKEKTLIQELEELERLKKESPRATRRIKEKEDSIITEINKIFSEIKDKWNEYVRKLTGDNIEIDCSVEKLGSLDFKIKWNGRDVRNIMNYLNEGRLNAISLGLFLSYYKRFNASPYRLLLLDDVVIGLDMNLRLPLLDIIKDDFENEYQIIITTFDENWFNLMKNYLNGEKWEFLRLIIRSTDNRDMPFLIGIETSDFLQKAEEYFQRGDISASALYARLEFERLVIRYAEKKRLRIAFKRRIQEIPINEIWNEVKTNLPRAKTICNRIDTYKSILLNPAVHYDDRPKYKNEVKYAIDAVKKLREKIRRESR